MSAAVRIGAVNGGSAVRRAVTIDFRLRADEVAGHVDRAMTVGHGEYEAAEEHGRAGRLDRAVEAFEALARAYPATWFERIARERLASLAGRAPSPQKKTNP